MLLALQLTRICLWVKMRKLFTEALITIQIYQIKSFCHEKIFWINILKKLFLLLFFLDLAKPWSSLVLRKLLCQKLVDPYLYSPFFTFSGNVDLTTPFGGAGINANVGLPASGNNLLTTAVIGLGVSSLVNTVATVVIPFFNTGNKTTARSMRNLFPQTTLESQRQVPTKLSWNKMISKYDLCFPYLLNIVLENEWRK